MAQAERSTEDNNQLREYFLLHAPELKEEQQKNHRIAKADSQTGRCPCCQKNVSSIPATHRHLRGEFMNEAEDIKPGVPQFLPSLPTDAPADRLTFARWLASPANPLTARVLVNRQWQAFFGRGIVKTVEDFGMQGEYPTHPQLLDYLATKFMEQGWSLKRLHKLVVMSSTYQQSATITPQLLEQDPENKWLARAPRYRLDAELIRDVVLESGQLLSSRVGGPSAFPDQPFGVTETAYGPLEWKLSAGEDRFRRGLYTFNKRTVAVRVVWSF